MCKRGPGILRRFLNRRFERARVAYLGAACALLGSTVPLAAQSAEPWKRDDRALVIDAYEYNQIDWHALSAEKRLAAFIGKASDGLPPAYSCSGNEVETRLCGALWKRYAVSRELYHTRRAMARSLGLKWGAYHLGRPGNPIDQANHFIDFAQPGPDDLIAIDIEDNDPEKWISLEDAEEFARHIKRRVGRFPVLYTNGSTAKYIADNKDRYRLLSRLPLWYARYSAGVDMHFPKGNWSTYTLWQFLSQENCNSRRCPYRIPGTGYDIDINVASMSVEALHAAWPFGGLIDQSADRIASVPLPVSREDGLSGKFTLAYASVALTDPPLVETAEPAATALPVTLTALAEPELPKTDPRLAALDRLASGALREPPVATSDAEAVEADLPVVEPVPVTAEPVAEPVVLTVAAVLPDQPHAAVEADRREPLLRAYPGAVPIAEVLARLPGLRSCAASDALPVHVAELDDVGVPSASPLPRPARAVVLLTGMADSAP